MSLQQITDLINALVNEKLLIVANALSEREVDKNIIDEVMGLAQNGRNYALEQNCPRNNNEKISPRPRLSENSITNTITNVVDVKKEYVPTEKYPQVWTGTGKVVIITDYSDVSVAIFGDFNKTHISFKDEYLKKHSNIISNNRLMFGFGWIVPKTKHSELKQSLRIAKIKYEEYTIQAYKIKIGVNPNIITTNINSGVANNTTELESKKVKLSVKKNEWGNHIEPNANFVLTQLPIGKKNKLLWVCIGTQNTKVPKNLIGIDSVIPLDEAQTKIALEQQFKTLSSEYLETIKVVDRDIYAKLIDMNNRKEIEIDNEDKSSSSESSNSDNISETD